jgi:hypothetical protein
MSTLLNREEVATELRVSPGSAFEKCRKHGCPVLRLGHRTSRVRKVDLDEMLVRLARGEAPVTDRRRPSPLAGKTKRAGVSTGPRRKS